MVPPRRMRTETDDQAVSAKLVQSRSLGLKALWGVWAYALGGHSMCELKTRSQLLELQIEIN